MSLYQKSAQVLVELDGAWLRGEVVDHQVPDGRVAITLVHVTDSSVPSYRFNGASMRGVWAAADRVRPADAITLLGELVS